MFLIKGLVTWLPGPEDFSVELRGGGVALENFPNSAATSLVGVPWIGPKGEGKSLPRTACGTPSPLGPTRLDSPGPAWPEPKLDEAAATARKTHLNPNLKWQRSAKPRRNWRPNAMVKFSLFLWVLLLEILLLRGELWEEDLSSAMKIGLSTSGYRSVDLRCDSSHFSVNVTLEDDFRGVVYTRGSFNEKKLPCFKRHDQKSLGENDIVVIALRIPFHGCKTVMDVAESRYTNTLVVQHDPDLIMPGDAAFNLNCAFIPEFKVSSELGFSEPSFRSKITLVDADPSAEKTNLAKRNFTVFSKGEKVTFRPPSGKTKDEL